MFFLLLYFCLMIEGYGTDPDPYLWLMDPYSDPGGPETYGSFGSGFGSGSATLLSWLRLSVMDLGPLPEKYEFVSALLRRS